MTTKIQSFWDKEADKYDSRQSQFGTVFDEVISKTQRYLCTKDNVLDFGCATGLKTIKLAKAAGYVHGLDISTAMITKAILNKNRANIMNCFFFKGTIFNNDLIVKSFDKIVCYHVIHLIEDVEGVLEKIHDLLKPGGLFILTTVCLKDKITLMKRLEITAFLIIKKLGFLPIHLNKFTVTDVEKTLEKGNFEILESSKFYQGVTTSFIIAKKITLR